ncbi:amino acid racemase [Acetomicrobium sp.]|uniref:aspartate/glutamate racemase family protein n=1 Tax=Acetomicrobium sp. TaxID=1872099 RepID=UPI002FCC96DA
MLDREGASYILICCNTIHKIADAISKSLHNAELINIIDVVAEAIHPQNMTKVGLLGSIYTMEELFYKERLSSLHKVKTLIPNSEERKLIMHIIETELGKGEMDLQSRKSFLKIGGIDDLVQRGAEGVILGCTEIPLLISKKIRKFRSLIVLTYMQKAGVDLALR